MVRFLTQFLASQKFLATNTLVAAMSCLFVLASSSSSLAVNETNELQAEIDSHLRSGEVAKAIELVKDLPTASADESLDRIARSQSRSGNFRAATKTIDLISSDRLRYRALFQRGIGPGGFGVPVNRTPTGTGNNTNGNSAQAGLAGGVTEADFQPLINLIKSAIAPESWDDVNGDGTIQAYPTGVFVDASGTLQKLKLDPKRNLKQLALRSRINANSGQNFGSESPLRKVSLNRLERQAQMLSAAGRSLSPEMRNLAGILSLIHI